MSKFHSSLYGGLEASIVNAWGKMVGKVYF